jgi:hypothetical protein
VTELEKAEAALEAARDAWHYSETWGAWEAVEAAKEAVMAAKAAQEKPE